MASDSISNERAEGVVIAYIFDTDAHASAYVSTVNSWGSQYSANALPRVIDVSTLSLGRAVEVYVSQDAPVLFSASVPSSRVHAAVRNRANTMGDSLSAFASDLYPNS